MSAQRDEIDFALAVYLDDDGWQVQELIHRHLDDVDTLAEALRRFPGETGAVGLVAIDEDFFLIVRVAGDTTRVLLSDITAADDWDLADSAIEFLGIDLPEDDADQVPAGDLSLLADLGMSELDLAALLDDIDLYPEEVLSDVARALGFGERFDDVVGLTTA